MKDKEMIREFEKRVQAKIGFYTHLGVYLGINTLLPIINLSTSSRYLWFKWPLLGTSIGILAHFVSVFIIPRIAQNGIKERMMEKEMQIIKNLGRAL